MKTRNAFVQVAVSAALCVAAAILPMAAGAATYYVSPDGDDDNNNGKSWAAPFATIQKAMSSANAWGGSIWISNGTYKIESELVLLTDSNGITIRSFSGDPADVTIDAQGLCRCFNGSAGWDLWRECRVDRRCAATVRRQGGHRVLRVLAPADRLLHHLQVREAEGH